MACVCLGFDGAVEFRSHKDPAFDLVRKEADIGLQVLGTTTQHPPTPQAGPLAALVALVEA